MVTLDTEFGTVYSVQNGNYVDVFVKHESNEIHLGWIKDEWGTADSTATVTYCVNRYIEIFLTILRHETKSGFFNDIPLDNPFRDAVLRLQIENSGQTLDIRNFIQDYNQEYNWITYAKNAEYYDLSEFRNSAQFIFCTPYGRYNLIQIDPHSFNLIRTKEGTDSILALIRVPYNENQLNIFLAACQQAVEIIMGDTQDTLLRKLKEISKRTAEAIKYMFNYDKLRQSIRKKSIQ